MWFCAWLLLLYFVSNINNAVTNILGAYLFLENESQDTDANSKGMGGCFHALCGVAKPPRKAVTVSFLDPEKKMPTSHNSLKTPGGPGVQAGLGGAPGKGRPTSMYEALM